MKRGEHDHAQERGLRSDALKQALEGATRGRYEPLETLLARHGNLPAPRPNRELAAAFGVEVASLRADVGPLLERLARDDAAPDTAEAFLPIAAGHAYAALIRARREVDWAWAALPALLADERDPVRLGVRDAVIQLCAQPGQSDRLVSRATDWLLEEGREERFAVAAAVCEVLADPTVLSNLREDASLRRYLSAVLADASDAPRTSSRMPSYRRVLAALSRGLAAAVAHAGATGANAVTTRAWLTDECARAHHPPVRDALSAAISALRLATHGQSASVVSELRGALGASAKPPRDPTRIRPGLGRGKRSRPIR